MAGFDYKTTREQLDAIMAWFESEDVAVDEAIKKYQQAEELLKKLEKYLSDTKAQVDILIKNRDTKG